jgi:signal peptidase
MILNCELIPASPSLLSSSSHHVIFSYAHGQDHLNRSEDIVGSVRGYIPMVGYVTIMLSEHPWLKSVLLGIMGLMVVLQRE